MLIYSQADFCTKDQGLDYIFGRMGAIYGSAFTRHWESVDLSMVRQTWGDLLGIYATYKPTIDFAISHLGKFVPSAIEFKDLCSQAGRIPDKPHSIITKQPTQVELEITQQKKEEALIAIKRFTKSFRKAA